MESFIHRNLALLKKEFPSVYRKVANLKNTRPFILVSFKKPNIFLGKRAYHSTQNPLDEALNLVKDLNVDSGIIFIFMGIGLGYHIEKFKELYKNIIPLITIICIEKSIRAFTLLLQQRDISFLRGVHLFVGEEAEEINNFFNNLNPLYIKGYRIIRLRGAFSLFEKYYSHIEELFRYFMSVKLSDLLTRFAFENLWMKNIIDNTPAIIGKRSIVALKGTLKDRPALVLGAGPSLLSQLETIKKLKDRVYIISVDTALEPILTAGIKPDLVITLDAQFFNLLDFHSIFMGANRSTEIMLIADLVVYPKIISYWRGPIYFSQTAIKEGSRQGYVPLISKLEKYSGSIGSLKCGGSVMTSAIDLALQLGACPILLAGCDFSYTWYTTHVSSSSPYIICYRRSNRINTISTSMAKRIVSRRLAFVEGTGKRPVLSDFVFKKYITWFRDRKEYRNLVYNTTPTGAKIPGIKQQDLQEFLNSFKKRKPPILPQNTEIFTSKMALDFLNSLNTELERARAEIGKNHDIRYLAERYPFLQNSFHIAQKLFGDEEKSTNHLLLLIELLKRRTEISIGRIQNQ